MPLVGGLHENLPQPTLSFPPWAGRLHPTLLPLSLPSLLSCLLQLHLPICLKLHTAVLSGHGVCNTLALPPSTRSLVLLNVMRDARTLSLATMVGGWMCGLMACMGTAGTDS